MVAREVFEAALPPPKEWPNGEIFTYSIDDYPQHGTVLKLEVQNSPLEKGKSGPFYAMTEIDFLLERDLEYPEHTLQQLMTHLEQAYDAELNGEKYRKERQERRAKYRGRNKPPEMGVDTDE